MERYIFAWLSVTTLLTVGQPILAQDSASRMQIGESSEPTFSELNPRINTQLGLSNFEQTKSAGSQKSAAYGATVEVGQSDIRKLETGLMVVPMGSDKVSTTYLTIPMMAKLRIMAMRAQSWYGKIGFFPAFELNTSNRRASNNVDVLMSAGVGGRLLVTRKIDFIIEGTYNRGLMDNVRGGKSEYNQGFLILGGLSIRI